MPRNAGRCRLPVAAIQPAAKAAHRPGSVPVRAVPIDRRPRHLDMPFAHANGVAYGVRDSRAQRATRGVRWQETT
jgi:hypothetical protein